MLRFSLIALLMTLASVCYSEEETVGERNLSEKELAEKEELAPILAMLALPAMLGIGGWISGSGEEEMQTERQERRL